jgi:hypothetical protein
MKTLQECKDEVARMPYYGYVNWEDMESEMLLRSKEGAIALMERLSEAAELYASQSKWVSVSERLPGVNVNVLTIEYIPYSVFSSDIDIARLNQHGEWYRPWKKIEVTHWQPLPTPPTK